MLCLTRHRGERIIIGAAGEIVIEVLKIKNGQCQLGITAPKDIPVNREEAKKRYEQEDDHE